MAKGLKYLFFDTEMSGCDQLVSLGYVVTDGSGNILDEDYYVIKPHKKIRKSTIAIHGITTEQAQKEGIPVKKGLAKFINAAKECHVHVGFAPQNDILALAIAWKHLGKEVPYDRGEWLVVDVARLGVPYMLERKKINEGQTPRLCGLYAELFDGEAYEEHNALSDAKATAKCFWKLMNDGQFTFSAVIPHYKIHHLCEPKRKSNQQDVKGPEQNSESKPIDAETPANTETTTAAEPEKPKVKKTKKKSSPKKTRKPSTKRKSAKTKKKEQETANKESETSTTNNPQPEA